MTRHPLLCVALFASVAFLNALPGCARKEEDDIAPPPVVIGQSGAADTKKPLPVESYDGVIRGKVVYAGEAPKMAIIEGMTKHADKAHCLGEDVKDVEKKYQQWIVGPDGGVENVVIYLKAPPGKYFELTEELRQRSDIVNIDQPHCAFVPHVQVAFPKYYDATSKKSNKLEPTGQRFIVKNSAKMPHNTNYRGDPLKTGGGSVNIAPDGFFELKSLTPESSFIPIVCDVHPWMSGRIWAFDHPFAARTKEDGSFEIKNVPTGVEVGLVAWHEGAGGFFNGDKNGTPIKLTRGEVMKVELKVSAK